MASDKAVRIPPPPPPSTDHENRVYIHAIIKLTEDATVRDVPIFNALGKGAHDRTETDFAKKHMRNPVSDQGNFLRIIRVAEHTTAENLDRIKEHGRTLAYRLKGKLYKPVEREVLALIQRMRSELTANESIRLPVNEVADKGTERHLETQKTDGGLFHLCIYTIKHSDDLQAALKNDGQTSFTEGTNWAKANQLLKEARSLGQRLPVVFAPAEGTRRLFGWATLDDIKLGDRTEYTFSNLIAFRNRPLKTTLKKQSDGLAISADYIRPYLICQTPDYLSDAAPTVSQTADSIAEALEGTRTEIRHLTSQRNRRLRDSAFANANGVCVVCGRNFSNLLNGRGTLALQVHHRKQLSAFEMPTVTTLEDLAVVCANCHCLLHLNPKKALLIEDLKKMLTSEKYP